MESRRGEHSGNRRETYHHTKAVSLAKGDPKKKKKQNASMQSNAKQTMTCRHKKHAADKQPWVHNPYQAPKGTTSTTDTKKADAETHKQKQPTTK